MKNNNLSTQELTTRFEFRNIHSNETEIQQAVTIEQICFPPHEACSEKNMMERIAVASDMFFVAVDKKTGKIAGFINGLSTNECLFRDEFFTDANLHNPNGKTIMILGLDVLPEYRMQGLAKELMRQYLNKAKQNGCKTVILTCLDSKVAMYKKMGYQDNGLANSSWGDEKWHEMTVNLI